MKMEKITKPCSWCNSHKVLVAKVWKIIDMVGIIKHLVKECGGSLSAWYLLMLGQPTIKG